MTKALEFAPELIEKARALRAEGKTWARIARLCGGGHKGYALRRTLDPVWRDQQIAKSKERGQQYRHSVAAAGVINEQRIEPTPQAAQEWQRAFPEGFYVAGDMPPPGRSALDRRREA